MTPSGLLAQDVGVVPLDSVSCVDGMFGDGGLLGMQQATGSTMLLHPSGEAVGLSTNCSNPQNPKLTNCSKQHRFFCFTPDLLQILHTHSSAHFRRLLNFIIQTIIKQRRNLQKTAGFQTFKKIIIKKSQSRP